MAETKTVSSITTPRYPTRSSVPPEDFWITEEALKRENGGLAIQRLTADTSLHAIADEKINNPEGHLRGADIVPRPEENGGCDCIACTGAKNASPEKKPPLIRNGKRASAC